jgi:pimeloyl-ACP methyl ester carboxylesterase
VSVLVVVPGFATRSSIWPVRFREALEAHHRVCWVDRVETVLKRPIEEGAVLVGWSFGARVLGSHPEVSAARMLITLGYHQCFGFGVPVQQGAFATFLDRYRRSPKRAIRRFQQLVVRGESNPVEALQCLAAATQPVAEINLEQLALLGLPMPDLPIPVIPLVGQDDPLCQLPKTKLPGGHLGFLSYPDQWARAILGVI